LPGPVGAVYLIRLYILALVDTMPDGTCRIVLEDLILLSAPVLPWMIWEKTSGPDPLLSGEQSLILSFSIPLPSTLKELGGKPLGKRVTVKIIVQI